MSPGWREDLWTVGPMGMEADQAVLSPVPPAVSPSVDQAWNGIPERVEGQIVKNIIKYKSLKSCNIEFVQCK